MQTEWNFGYNGSPQSVILKPGKYKFECWGSSGGINNSSWYTDAKGGYSKGEITLKNKLHYMFTSAKVVLLLHLRVITLKVVLMAVVKVI